MKRIKPAILLTCVLALLCAGWGYEGHRIVGAIAWHYLTPEAKAAVAKLLKNEGDGTLSEAATWADRIKSDRKWDWAKPLHYANVAPGADSFDLKRDCPESGCVVSAIITTTLTSPTGSTTWGRSYGPAKTRAAASASVRQITNNEWFNQSISLNDRGEIIWAEFEICRGGTNWRSLIKLYSNGVVTTLSEPGLQAQYTTINNDGLCAWMFFDPVKWVGGIQTWQNGSRSLLTSWGEAPDLSDFGLSFTRWDENTATRHIWLHRNGEFRQLTFGPISNTECVINERGEVAWLHGSHPDLDLWVMRRFPDGDLNCDGAFNGADIDLFFLALGDPAAYDALLPNCDPLLGDMNGDGRLDGGDIDPFFACLGGNCP